MSATPECMVDVLPLSMHGKLGDRITQSCQVCRLAQFDIGKIQYLSQHMATLLPDRSSSVRSYCHNRPTGAKLAGCCFIATIRASQRRSLKRLWQIKSFPLTRQPNKSQVPNWPAVAHCSVAKKGNSVNLPPAAKYVLQTRVLIFGGRSTERVDWFDKKGLGLIPLRVK